MATLFGSPPFLISLSKTRTHHFSSSSSSKQAPPLPPSQPPFLSPTSSQLLTTILTQQPSPVSAKVQQPQKPAATESTVEESSDWIASSTLTRRFGLGSGIAWAAFLGIGVLSQHLKTGLDEVSLQEENTGDVEKQEEVVLPNGIRYFDLRVGGGAAPRPGGGGDLVVIDLRGNIQGRTEQLFVDTFGGSEKTPPVAVVMSAGWSRPYAKGMCEGIECVLRSMKAGGRRRVIVPPSLGFGEKGADFGCGFQIPPNVALEYVVEVDKVSILHPPIA